MLVWLKSVLGLVRDSFTFTTRSGPSDPVAGRDAGPDSPSRSDVDSDSSLSREFYGRHLLANYCGCDPRALRDLPRLREVMGRAVRASGAALLESVEHIFPPDGMTIVLLLAESHASVHTYPEHNACFVDLFTCGRTCSAERFDEVIRAFLRPTRVGCQVVIRNHGILQDALRAPSIKAGIRPVDSIQTSKKEQSLEPAPAVSQ